ncbi:efflux RND transporter periplasmic adaptor subunit [Waterburya agarophytonicola K14]|uniref:Efflux RND transporter periplasmic adaptor subunit n=1 Tax=Waterburya agarophytonicola KI4 TaxID=2874699 RepID=A0A964BNG9_9CYAN|nr:efflux RND transporter periplasmic adaptor subunit [Waterburya agarophytonicola KI4]
MAIIFLGSSIVITQGLLPSETKEQVNSEVDNQQFDSQSDFDVRGAAGARVKEQKTEKISVETVGSNIKANILPVETTTLKLVNSYSRHQTYTGEVVPSRTSEIGFENGGKLVRILIEEGDRVSLNTPLAQLDTANLEAQRQGLTAQKNEAQARLAELNNGATSEEINSAQAQVRDLEQQLELENIRAKRREYLYSEGAVNREELEEITFNSKALAERLANATSNLKQLQNGSRIEQVNAGQAVVDRLSAEIKNLDITIANSTLRSPFEGIVSARNFDEGSVVSPGQAVLRLVENEGLKVKVGVSIEAAHQLRVGSSQTLTIGQKEYKAKIASILPEVNASTRNLTVVLKLTSAEIGQVSPKQIARLDLIQKSEGEGYWLPVTALVKGDKGLWSCFALDKSQEDLKVERRLVELIETQNERVLVRGTLQPGDEIITEGTHRLVPGQVVNVATEG